jgi:methylenetetrahydrofolate reductase (NADPH)
MARIVDLLARGLTFSFEFFPPKTEEERLRLEATVRELEPLAPSFVSVTYRGGASSRQRTTSVVLNLLRTTTITPMPHLTCVAHPRAELAEIMSGFVEAGLGNLLALGGDVLPDGEGSLEVRHAIELVEMARSVGITSIGVAAHPNKHPRSPDLASDRRHLAAKLELADFAITQFFFEADEYGRLVDELAALGCHKPVVAGIMPVTNLSSVARMAELSGCAVPARVVERLEQAGEDPHAVRQAGIDIACELCASLLDAGVPGLHFYTLNRSTATREICAALGRPGGLPQEAGETRQTSLGAAGRQY